MITRRWAHNNLPTKRLLVGSCLRLRAQLYSGTNPRVMQTIYPRIIKTRNNPLHATKHLILMELRNCSTKEEIHAACSTKPCLRSKQNPRNTSRLSPKVLIFKWRSAPQRLCSTVSHHANSSARVSVHFREVCWHPRMWIIIRYPSGRVTRWSTSQWSRAG